MWKLMHRRCFCRFVMVKFLNDTIVQPKESQWFEFYINGQDKLIQPLKDSKVYTNVSEMLLDMYPY